MFIALIYILVYTIASLCFANTCVPGSKLNWLTKRTVLCLSLVAFALAFRLLSISLIKSTSKKLRVLHVPLILGKVSFLLFFYKSIDPMKETFTQSYSYN